MLDIVGWYALVPKTGPTALHLPIHRQISTVNESAVLLGLHIEDLLSPAAGDPLPITVYETNMEAEADSTGQDRSEAQMVLRFRKLPYTTETGEAEMIAMQYVREGGANAAVDSTEKHILEQFDKKIAVDDGKGKRRAVAYDDATKSKKESSPTSTEQTASPDANLTRAEAEYMSALQAKYNAIKMMKSRLALITAYLQHLPPAFTAGTMTTADAAVAARASDGQYTAPSNTILRQIQALVTNAALVSPTAEQAAGATTTTTTLQHEIQRESNDVQLISLLSDLVSSVNEVREAGKKFAVVEQARHTQQGLRGGRRGRDDGIAGFLDPGLLGPGGDFGGGGPGMGEY